MDSLKSREGQSLGWAAGTSRDVEEGVGKGAPLSLPSPARVLQNEVPGKQFKGKPGKLNGCIFHPLRSSHWCLKNLHT